MVSEQHQSRFRNGAYRSIPARLLTFLTDTVTGIRRHPVVQLSSSSLISYKTTSLWYCLSLLSASTKLAHKQANVHSTQQLVDFIQHRNGEWDFDLSDYFPSDVLCRLVSSCVKNGNCNGLLNSPVNSEVSFIWKLSSRICQTYG